MIGDINKRYEATHLANILKAQKRIKKLYEKAIDEIFKQSGAITLKGDTFKLSDYPVIEKAVNAIMHEFQGTLRAELINGIDDSWELSGSKFIELVSATYKGAKLPDGVNRVLYDKHASALKQFSERKVKGLNLSDRVWKYTNQFRSEIEQGLYAGISQGMSAVRMAQQQKQYLQEPDKLFRRVRDANGKLHLSQAAKQYKPGRGVYRSSFKNALRVSRNENNFAYRTADSVRWKAMPFILGFNVKLSKNHPRYDVCDKLAGKYPKDFVFKGWHVSCLCYSTPILPDEDEFEAYNQAVLEGTDEDFAFTGSVTNMPAGYNSWMSNNAAKINSGQVKPLWAPDNYKGGNVGKGLSFATTGNSSNSKSVNVAAMINGDMPTDKEVADILQAYAEQFPEDFRGGLGEVGFPKSQKYLMQHTMYYNTTSNQWIGKSKIDISKYTFVIDEKPFNPAVEFKAALAAIKRGDELSFHQEYSIESMWHEILHAKTKTPPRTLTKEQRKKMETLNQFVARHTYEEFLAKLGGSAVNKAEILDNGYGYRDWIKDWRKELKDAGISEELAIKELTPVLMRDYSKVAFEMLKFKAKYSK